MIRLLFCGCVCHLPVRSFCAWVWFSTLAFCVWFVYVMRMPSTRTEPDHLRISTGWTLYIPCLYHNVYFSGLSAVIHLQMRCWIMQALRDRPCLILLLMTSPFLLQYYPWLWLCIHIYMISLMHALRIDRVLRVPNADNNIRRNQTFFHDRR